MKKYLCLSLSMILLFMFMAGCSKELKVSADDVRTYSDETAHNILTALHGKNYENFSRDFSEDMKKAVTKEAFDKLVNDFEQKVGTYVSHEFSSASAKDKYIILIYKAKFTKEKADVAVRVVFEEKDNKMQVSGLYFDSPNLRKK